MHYFVKLRAERKHRGGQYQAGDVFPITEAEAVSFGDKFKPADVSATEAAAELMHKHCVRVQDVTATGDDGKILKPDVEVLVDGT